MSPYPQPAEYVYCKITNVQVSPDRSQITLSLMSDSGEQLPDVPVSVRDAGDEALEIVPGDRFTYDGETIGNRMPIALAARYQELQAKLNAMDVFHRAEARKDPDIVQTLRNAGYVFDADNRVVTA